MRNDRVFKVCELFAAVRIGKLAVISIVVELGCRKVCAMWAPKMIAVEISIRKKCRKIFRLEILQRSERVENNYR